MFTRKADLARFALQLIYSGESSPKSRFRGEIMMKKIAFVLTAIGLLHLAEAAPDPVATNIEKRINRLLSDTVNEGETSAEVLRIGGIPQVKCSQVIHSKGRRMVFCSVDIKTSYGENLSDHGQTTCTSLGFYLNKKGQVESDYKPDQFRKCLEQIYDSSYN